ncbi:FAD-dependent oxidoreductase [Duganella sp. LX20W]|uniref:FAD-dependent oxidoreductase n=1 Tax=Rugamonas brunnea TaxID=2758569 RepID=A0A7W2EWC8_9BURK|nr:FAD-dependent oxidoreductase [Rugamonas brunnea]MBA5639796.1 FAD-dependent oxidoreductase [Rugamonas brunnea]
MRRVEEIDCLSLIAHKVASNVFDLSSRQFNVSIRDQLVRAQQLITDLKIAHPESRSLLVIGMGAAGMAAALAACEAGFDKVRVVDTRDQPFSLFRNVKSRFVGPYMYEWPSSFHGNQSYPCHETSAWGGYGRSPLSWEAEHPISADELAEQLTRSVQNWIATALKSNPPVPIPAFYVNVGPRQIGRFVKEFAEREAVRAIEDEHGAYQSAKVVLDWMGTAAAPWNGLAEMPPQPFAPDYVIIAAGMGTEVVRVPGARQPASQSFWADDDLKSRAVTKERIVVLGGGDGAIQDTLRILTHHNHPLSLIRDIESVPAVRDALQNELPALLSVDRQLRQHGSWSRDSSGLAMADAACKQAAARLASNPTVVRQVRKTLRNGTGQVIHIVRGQHFDKAYLLNRFVIYLLEQCLRTKLGRATPHMQFKLSFGFDVKRCVDRRRKAKGYKAAWTLRLGRQASKSPVRSIDADKVVVRFGVDPSSIPGATMIQISERVSQQRSTLTRVELPFVALGRKRA